MRMRNKTLAILTPTFNRQNKLLFLYESLKKQKCKDFNWYIIDDGSNDSTETLIETFSLPNSEIIYIKKENGGKHTAINKGMEFIVEDLVIIVDSDDTLSSDAVSIICDDYKKYKNLSDIAGISYCKVNKQTGSVVGDSYKENFFKGNYISTIMNSKIKGDKAEVFKNLVLKKYPFPIFENEKFLAESIVWIRIAADFNFLYSNKSFYLCEYLPDGLTSTGRKKIFTSPNGYALYSFSMMRKGVRFDLVVKYMFLFIISSKACGKHGPKFDYHLSFFKKVMYCLLFIPSSFLFHIWKRRYVK